MPSTSLNLGFPSPGVASLPPQRNGLPPQRNGLLARCARRRAYIAQVKAAMRREPGSFEALYRSHHPMVNAVAVAFGPCGENDDIVQEAFIQAFEKLDTLRRPIAFGGWLRKIAKNIALGRCGKGGSFDMYESSPDPNGLGEIDQLERMSASTLIRSLPDDDRDVVVMRFAEGMSYQEIAEVTGLSVGSVGVKLSRCKKKLERFRQFTVRRS